mmetsp:Transcript_32445/g.74142  ORF Transcript_32445/g.74142 Transcript_32445/m.74142 type:complete len:309 (-) Transcript_32445:336-1262(-)
MGHYDGEHVAAHVKIADDPGHYMNHKASHLVDADSVEYWASPPGHVRDQAFVFELDQGHVLVAVEWKDRGDEMGVAKLTLEAHVGEAWQKLLTWDATQTADWQRHSIGMSLCSGRWRLTFLCNHGDKNHLVVQAVRFIVKLLPAAPAHNLIHSQRMGQSMWRDQLFTDVEVVCGARRFRAHRAMLAAASPVFAAMLSCDMKESKEQEIMLEDTTPEAVQDTLEYIYTGKVGDGATCEVIVLGRKYDIQGLIEYGAPVALGNLTAENVVSEVRTLRAFADDKQLSQVYAALQFEVHENPELFRAVLNGV